MAREGCCWHKADAPFHNLRFAQCMSVVEVRVDLTRVLRDVVVEWEALPALAFMSRSSRLVMGFVHRGDRKCRGSKVMRMIQLERWPLPLFKLKISGPDGAGQ
jgi:hypothetical protein